ncbi:MAG: bidirectional hydrogenase complex protein HoxE [Zetaproteobacteria bacterium]|nr:MAG: bidirectional hydrogenase complex protein HoxE [Zetaproteobacteria bacterium]
MESATVVAKTQPSGRGPTANLAADARLKTLGAAMKRHQYQPDALIEVLHTAQELYGYLDLDLLVYIAQGLKLPPSRVYGVATFYHFFSLEPKGKHTCVVCMGTACYVKGAATLVKTVEDYAKVRSGETRADGSMSLVQARCIGACGIAPAVVLDGVVIGHQTPESVVGHVKGWIEHGSDRAA